MEKLDHKKYLDDKNNNQELDLSKYINIFIRKKKLFVITTFLITFFGVIYTVVKEPIYRGYFQIIVENQGVNGLIERSQILETLNNYVVDYDSNNKTQEAILKSPFVLEPVYKFFQNERKKKGTFREISYKKWLTQYLKIEFEKGTNILSIKFDNEDKDLIIATLNLISKSYQNYSMEDREKSIKKGVEYLEYQQVEYKEKSLKSLKVLNEFSIQNGLVSDLDGIVDFENSIQTRDKSFEDSFEKNDFTTGLRYSSQFKMLEDEEAKLLELSAKLKPNSKTLSDLKLKIQNLKESLKRPNEILLEFRELNRLAKRDEEFLANIEKSLSILRLEQVKQLNPWQLITEPTFEDGVVSPNRNRIIIFSFLISLIFSGFLCIYKENEEGFIYEIEDFNKIIPFKLEDTFLKKFPNLNELIIKNIFSKINGKDKLIGLIILNNNFFKGKDIDLPDYLMTKYKFKIIHINILEEIDKLEKTIIIAEPSKIKYSRLALIISFLRTFDSEKFSWIYVKEKID